MSDAMKVVREALEAAEMVGYHDYIETLAHADEALKDATLHPELGMTLVRLPPVAEKAKAALAALASLESQVRAEAMEEAAGLKREVAWFRQFHRGETENCTGDVETCPVDECSACSVRVCPHGDEMHFHHDGCPSEFFEERARKEER